MEDNRNLFDSPITDNQPQGSAFPDPTIPVRHPEMPSIPVQVEQPVKGESVSTEKLPEMPQHPVQPNTYTQQTPAYTQQASPQTQQTPAYTQQAPAYTQQAPAYTQQPLRQTVPPPAQYHYEYNNFAQPQGQPVPSMNRKIFIAAAVIAVLIFLLCAFCIAADLLHGALDGNGGTVHEVVINVQPKPELDPDDENVTADGEYTVKGVAELVKPSIVEVYAYKTLLPNFADLAGTGSGIIVSEDGFIITNAHVVDGMSFKVVLDDDTEYEAELIGSDAKTDLAVLKIDAHDLTAATLGDSDEVYVGETVVAIGNPAGLTNTVTKGIVSAINRQVRSESNAFDMDCIQTDAAISPGNSGGALVNMYGQVIGITSSKYASNYIQGNAYEGLGFAITINEALPIIEDLISQGYVSGRFRIGISFYETDNEQTKEIYLEEMGKELPKELDGLWIISIAEDCDISNTELQPFDFIVAINDVEVTNYDEVIQVLDGYKGGDTVYATCARVEDDDTITYFDIAFKVEVDTSGNY